MELPPEEANFRTIDNLLLSVIPNYLRRYFKLWWNKNDLYQKWRSNCESGEFLVNKLSMQFDIKGLEKLKTGNEKNWGITILANVLLDLDLKLVTEHLLREEIEKLREIEQSFHEDKANMKCSFDNFKWFARSIRSASRALFGKSENDEIDSILKSHEERMKSIGLEKEVKGTLSILVVYLAESKC